VSVLLGLLVCCAGCGGEPEADITPAEAQAIAREAYVYGFPVVMNLKTMTNYVLDKEAPDYKGPFNQIVCEARLFTPEDKTIVTPNSDTPYCMFWMDLRAEPQVLTVPEMEPERFYHFQLIDLYTHNYGYVGTLTTGNGAGRYLLTGPDWAGETPDGITAVLQSETDFVFNVTRTQLFGPDDLDTVAAIQADYDLQPLSTFLGTEAPPAVSEPAFPAWVEGVQFDERFYGYLDFMMTLLETPGEGEQDLWTRLGRLGIGPDGTYDYAALSPDIQAALKAGCTEGFGDMEAFIKANSGDPLVSGKIFGTRAFLTDIAGTDFGLDSPALLRSVAAHMGLYGNTGTEAIYPTFLADADGQPLNAAATRYTLTFPAGQLPPVNAFWSLTMYDAQTQLFIDNSLDRYLLNSSMMEQFELEADGALVLHIGQAPPDGKGEGNWLPAPAGPFYMVMRLYGPKAEALSGDWRPAQVVAHKTS